MMTPQPLYTAENLRNPAFHLRYTWSGWPSSDSFPGQPGGEALEELDSLWKKDGMRRLETNWQPNLIQFTFSVTPQVSPVLFAARVKGRLQHALHAAGTPVKFSRKLAVRTIGDNTTADVEAYIQRQVKKEPLADARFKQFLEEFTIINPDIDLSQPTASGSGRYWYNLHLVLVVRERDRFADRDSLTTLRDQSLSIGEKKDYGVSTISVMPDHLHVALRGNIEHSPEQIALSFLNNLAYTLGQKPVWQYSYYVGTFSEYNMNAVRPRFKKGALPTQPQQSSEPTSKSTPASSSGW
jgi:REP element-mobilizing transposase RayT